jgi:hypothetical protein
MLAQNLESELWIQPKLLETKAEPIDIEEYIRFLQRLKKLYANLRFDEEIALHQQELCESLEEYELALNSLTNYCVELRETYGILFRDADPISKPQ